MLRIHNVRARYFLQPDASGRAASEWHTQRRLDRVVRERLPQTLAGRWARAAQDDGAVYRIRELHVSLWLDGDRHDDQAIAAIWAELLARAVAGALRGGPSANVMRYDDQAHFVAAFLADLLAGRAWSRWMYAEFRPLQGLPAGRIAALLLAPRPELLLPVARRLLARQQWEALLRRLEPADLDLIWDEGPGRAITPHLPALEALPPLPAGLPLEQGEGSFARNRLRLFVALSAQGWPAPEAAAVGELMARLQRVWQRRPAPWFWAALARGEIHGSAAIAPLLEGLADGAALAGWLAPLLPHESGRRYVARLVQALELAPDRPVSRPWQFATPYAGLALLLPVLRELALVEQVGPAGLYQILLQAAGPAALPPPWSDGAVAWMAGLSPREAEAARDAVVDWPEVAPEIAAEAAALSIQPAALLVLRRFAAGLRGFATSSPAYLAEQIFNQPGHLLVTEETIDVHLARSPLGIVLHMAGRTGEQGAIPWLGGRRLTITLP